ncbi:GRP family sugar transporter [Chryseolinea lacunae]|uniref:Multidrug DMT transporter permease n=1 Tax=Chryseolinea lacunae TaxID=2801331 RepID=A0ABS1KLZ2_9BACT|nr:GRP family sugar transporter [Chryseolinea lacunae]MBL0740262.1 multidrug DMT transporter permease [Chryseolinea lacunae]
MFILESYTVAVLFCFITMLCWGSWANTQKLAERSWRFELFYWDYVLGIFLMSLLFAFTLGSNGESGRGFLDDLAQADSSSLRSAFIGGVIFNLANILLIAAISIAGMSVAFPVGIGIALIWGVLDNYLKVPAGNPAIIFTGVILIAIGIVVNAVAYKKLTGSTQKVSSKGLIISVIAGVLMAQFYGFVVSGMTQNFDTPAVGKLTPYTAIVIFSAGILASNVIFNTVLMRMPIAGAPVSYGDYFKGNLKSHITGILGGIIWCVGMSFSILASDKAGPAISYGLGQGAVLVAAVWGVFIWKEFKAAPKGVNALLYIMFICFFVGLSLLVYSKAA